MRVKALYFLLAALVLVGLLAACGGASSEGEALLNERCESCHSLDLVYETEGTRADWEQIVNWMKTYGVELTDEEQTILVDYLAETYGP
jgi:hypothetical protein